MAKKYDAEQIKKLRDMEAIRRNPGMYIGDKREHGLHHILWELVSNSLDEITAGYGNRIQVRLLRDGSAEVTDDGRGIPVRWKPDEQDSALSLVFLKLHAGGKFAGSDSAYGSSGGMHGVGAKAANAMSEWLEVEVRRHGLRFRQRFENGGVPVIGVEIYDATRRKLGEMGPSTVIKAKAGKATSLTIERQPIDYKLYADLRTGTTVRFKPHRAFFDWGEMDWGKPDAVPWDVERLRERLSQAAFLQPGVRIEFADERQAEPETEVFYSTEGLLGYLDHLSGGQDYLHKPLYFKVDTPIKLSGGKSTIVDEGDGGDEVTGTSTITTEVAMVYVKGEGNTTIASFVNTIPTPQGGRHVSAFQAALTKAVKAFADEKKQLKKGDDIRGDDVLLGLAAVVNITMTHTPQFLGQTKESLTSPEVYGPVMSAAYENISAYLAKNISVGKLIVRQAVAAAHGRAAATLARQHIIKSNGLDEPGSELAIKKLSDVQRRGGTPLVPLEHTALFIVEGDSAGGSCKLGRNALYHAILPLRGKPKNVWALRRTADAYKNEEISAILRAIGGVNGGGKETTFDPETMRYGRVVITTDADDDGYHIQVLLLALFWKLRPGIIQAGRLFVARPPLYLIKPPKGTPVYAYTDEERDRLLAQLGKADIQRYKGLGEMSAEQVSQTILALPEEVKAGQTEGLARHDFTAHEILVTVSDAEKATAAMELLLGKSEGAEARREWLMGEGWE